MSLPIDDHEAFLKLIGADLRRLRLKANKSLEAVADVAGFSSKDGLSKVELGVRNISLFRYLKMMQFYRDIEPKHPALSLLKYSPTEVVETATAQETSGRIRRG